MTGDLFAGLESGPQDSPRQEAGSRPTESDQTGPLAARMRPRTVEEFEGQGQLLSEGRALRAMLDRGTLSSMILWGPPGCGKTTLARLLAGATEATFVQISAVTAGVKQIREVTAQAKVRLETANRRTVLFCDEIHRFNKGQQDAFLPHVEDGTVVLIGATTENPSFEVVRPLLSRAPVYVLEPLDAEAIERLLERALRDAERGLGQANVHIVPDALKLLATAADGDARRALGALEAAVSLAEGDPVTIATAQEALQHRFAAYDKSGESHYNLISALHKSVRGSSPDGALYWLARMLEGGEDPMYLARRLIRMAVEDIGLADPNALRMAVSARDAYHFLGSPEGDLALAQACVYLATAPKSNRAYEAFKNARGLARDTPAAPVPHHLRNAPTSLMKDLGYGEGYRYDHNEPGGVADQRYLPDGLDEHTLYRPTQRGYEARIAERLQQWEAARQRSSGRADDSDATDR